MLPTHRAPTHPGEMLLDEFLKPLGVSQVEAADRMNIPFSVSTPSSRVAACGLDIGDDALGAVPLP